MKMMFSVFRRYFYCIAAVCCLLMSSCESKNHEFETVKDIFERGTIAVMEGSLYDIYISQNYPNANLQRMNSTPECAEAVISGKCDALMAMDLQCKYIIKSNPELKMFSHGLMSIGIGAGFPKGSTLVSKFNVFLQQIKANGIYNEMYKRWFECDIDTVQMPKIPLPETGKQLTVCVTGTQIPFNTMNGDECVGFDIELAYRFAAYLNRPVTFMITSFQGLVPALETNKADLAMSSLIITPERAKQIDFSVPYCTTDEAELVLEKSNSVIDINILKSISESIKNNLITENRYQLIIDGLYTTLIITFFAVILGTILAGIICWMRMSKRKILRNTAKVYIDLMRGTPVLVLLMLMYYVFLSPIIGSAIIVAVITFAMNSSAYICEMLRTNIEAIDNGQTEAGLSLGFTKMQTFFYIVLPQAVKNMIPVYQGEIISLLKSTSVVGYIAIMDMTKASDIIRSRTFDAFFPLILVAVIYFFIAWLIGLCLDRFSRYINEHSRNKKTVSAVPAKPTTMTHIEGIQAPADEMVISISHLKKVFDRKLEVLKDVSIDVKRGEVISIIGPSGTGKSTFLRCLNLLEQPTSGSIIVADSDILSKDANVPLLRQKMGMVFQSFNLFNGKTILENITFAPMKLLKESRSDAEKKAMSLLHLVGLAEKADSYPSQLSGGQKQRVAIARSLAMKPDILLFDEPTSALDPTMVSEVLGVIRTLARKNMTMMIVTHEMRFAQEVSTRVLYLDEGVIYEEGTPEQIFGNPQTPKARVFINQMREFTYSIKSYQYDFYEMMSGIEYFCDKYGLSVRKKHSLQHVVEEVLLVLGVDNGAEVKVLYLEKLSQIEVSVTANCRKSEDVLSQSEHEYSVSIINQFATDITLQSDTDTTTFHAKIKP